MLYRIGFCNKGVELVMRYIGTVFYAIIVNGIPLELYQPTRGIKQGDPLSPYMFIICADALSDLISKAKGKGLIHGVPMAKGKLRIFHLFFADDSLIFLQGQRH